MICLKPTYLVWYVNKQFIRLSNSKYFILIDTFFENLFLISKKLKLYILKNKILEKLFINVILSKHLIFN